MALALVASTLTPQIMPTLKHDSAPSVSVGTPVKVTPVPVKAAAKPKEPASYKPSHDAWPTAVSGTATLSATSAVTQTPATKASAAKSSTTSTTSTTSSTSKAAPAHTQVAGTPVWVSAVKAGTSTPSSVSASVLSHQTAQSVGVDGVVFTANSTGGSGSVQLGLDYSSFAQAYGGNYGSRLTLVQLPACALTTPKVAACRVQKKLASTNDATGQSVSAPVALAAPAAKQAAGSSAVTGSAVTGTAATSSAVTAKVVLAAVAGVSGGDGGGAAGQYGATSLKPAGTWSAGGSSGSFSYSYPIALPPAASALAPQVTLSYDSGSVDGQTSASQSQADWLGDGWSTPENFIEQSFISCSDDPEGSAAPSSTQDECYDGPILTLSLNGSSIELVCNQAETSCSPSDDDGDVIQHVVPSSSDGSGTYNSDYWTVTDRSGTVYTFGLNKLPGWASGDATTNSVASEPVFSAHSGDPCYNATWSKSVCTMAYRWSLDYVKDAYGNAMAYYYTQATNAYGENGDTSGGAVSYIRDSYISHIDYGFRDGGAYGTVADRVAFTAADRCIPATGVTCDPLSSSTAANWPDVPYDLNCAAASACEETSPSVWSTVRLSGITTEQWNGSAYATIDSYGFNQTIPATSDGTAPTLWLSSITRTGADTSAGGSAVTLPAVTFTPVMLANRADIQDGLPALDRYRIGSIETETGSVIGVSYELTNPCSSPVTISPASNTSSCYPVYWTPSGDLDQILDWFNKYAVASVSQSDPAGGSVGTFTKYDYIGGPAWHYDDNELVQAKYRTYGQYRGYGDVQTFTGQGSDPLTESEDWYYRGMSDDNNSTAVTLTDSQKGTHDDSDALAGQTLESAQYTYDGGPVYSSTISDYWISPVTDSRTRTGLPALQAQMVEPDETWTRTAITDTSPASWRETADVTSYDANTSDPTFGLVQYVYNTGDLGLVGKSNSQETCTETTYTAPNTALNLVGLVAETRTLDKACGGTSAIGSSTPTAPTGGQVNGLTAPASVNLATDVNEDSRTFYDNPTLAGTWPQPAAPTWPQAAPALPQVSVNQAANGYNSSTGQLTYVTKSASLYDSYDRPSVDYDAVGDKTTYAYTMTSYGTVTGTTTTNPLGQSQTSVMDPTRSLVTSATDANGITTTVKYDGLGRTIAVWYYSRPTSAAANSLYTYAVSNSAATAVTTQTLNEESGYSTSVELYDSLLRPRQTQSPATTSTAGRIITDTYYDSHGWVVKSNANYYDNSSNPDTTLEQTSDQNVSDQTLTSYNGLGQAVEVQHKNNTADPMVDDVSYTESTGDKTITVPPAGGVTEATVVDALGRTTELDQYTSAPTVTTGTQGGFTTVSITGGTTTATTYGFNAHGLPSETTDASGDNWSTGYDFEGEATSTNDPDAGAASTQYDAEGRVVQTTDQMGNTLSYTYDALGRKTAEYDAPVTGQEPYSTTAPYNEVTSWTYDNSNKISGVADAIGQMTTENSYTSAGVFTKQAKGFNAFGESLGETYTVPGSTALAGTYSYTHSYTPTTGLPKSTLTPALGSLGQEITTAGYEAINNLDVPYSLGGLNGYTQAISYTDLGQVAQAEIGSQTNNAFVSNIYDPLTGALTKTNLINDAVSQSVPIDQTSYTYDPSGNPTSQTETRSGTQTETQCYAYDSLDRLTSAWTAANSCANTPTTANETTTVGDQISGGAYWSSWTFDAIGQTKTQTQHSTSGGTDTVTSYTYGVNNATNCGTTAGGGANTLNATSTTGPSGTAPAYYCSNTDGETTSMPSSSGQNGLSWNAEGQLSAATTSGGGTGYIYDGDGDLVERTDPGSVTLYLPGQQMVLETDNGSTTSTRFIALPGGGQVVETGTTSSYRFELTNSQGTATISLDSTLQNPTYQQYTPYGAQRGATPATWTDPNGYLGKTQDGSDGLVLMGAREYDPALGRFISLDPVLETSEPQELNGYTYSGGNPVTHSDPSGDLFVCAGWGPCVPPPPPPPPPTNKKPPTSTGSTGSTNNTGSTGGGSTSDSCAGLHGKMAFLCAGDSNQSICSATCQQITQESLACGNKGGVFDNGVCTITPPAKPHHWWETALEVAAIVVAVAVVVACAVQPELLPIALEAGTTAFADATAGTATLGMASAAASFSAGAAVATAAGADTLAVSLGLAATAAGAGYEAGGHGGGGDGGDGGGGGDEPTKEDAPSGSQQPVSLYRSPDVGNRASEANGLNAANHSGHDAQAYLGGQPDAAAQYAGEAHEPGFYQYTMKPGFLNAFPREQYEFPLENTSAKGLGLTEWRIPVDRFDEFNSYIDQPSTKWYDSALGYWWEN